VVIVIAFIAAAADDLDNGSTLRQSH